MTDQRRRPHVKLRQAGAVVVSSSHAQPQGRMRGVEGAWPHPRLAGRGCSARTQGRSVCKRAESVCRSGHGHEAHRKQEKGGGGEGRVVGRLRGRDTKGWRLQNCLGCEADSGS